MADDREIERLGSWASWAGDRKTWPVSAEGEHVVDWAIEVHRAHYGDQFLRYALDDRPPHPFVRFDHWPLSSAPAIVSLLARACGLAVLPKQAQKALRPRPERTKNADVYSDLHVLGIAGLAVRDGWQIDVEQALPSGRRPDLRLRRGVNEFWIEASSMGPDSERRRVEGWNDVVFAALRAVGSKRQVEIGGSATSTELIGDPLKSFLERVDRAAEHVSRSGTDATLHGPGLTVEIRPPGSDSLCFDGPPLSSDMWVRIEQRLREKARQTDGSHAAWIYIEDSSNVFELTNLALLDEPRQLEMLAGNVNVAMSDCPHVTGVLLSTGLAIDHSANEHDTVLRDPKVGVNSATRVLRRRMPGGQSRRTFVIPIGDRITATLMAPMRWYELEDSWLDWALGTLGHPPLDRVLARR